MDPGMARNSKIPSSPSHSREPDLQQKTGVCRCICVHPVHLRLIFSLVQEPGPEIRLPNPAPRSGRSCDLDKSALRA